MNRIYLDHAATTPLLPEVCEAMLPWLDCGNPSSLHHEGRAARAAIDTARETLSGAIGAEFGEVIFTSSGTEAANLAILGAALGNENPNRNRILFSAVEHHCVLHLQPLLERLGYEVGILPVNRYGQVDVDKAESLIRPDVLLASVMTLNNELGTFQPDIQPLCSLHGVLVHQDAVQSLGWYPVSAKNSTVEMMSFSAHKLYGPKGAGALYIRAGTKVKPTALGGGQEREMRAGTENVAGVVGFGEAVLQMAARPDAGEKRRGARDAFVSELHSRAGEGFSLSVDQKFSSGGHAHLRFPGITAESMLILLDRMGVSASSGAACSSGSLEASHVLLACGYSEAEAREGLRFTFGMETTPEDAREAARRVADGADRIRSAQKRG